ncbi:alpha/beta hydrolase [Mucilaginibacter ginsenosidivorax]|uniref:Esterase family protein n=1 Tax=Mucilaginibacter ginsenosidivorax TaxID=862126 RepID=A0A5B8VWN7_9SPHI|nr:alpha/beta hydrolase-fold protein [Mucilaginibacter ginsenosidivorax]QEC75611.1 esterase family protein [Mucilaginibacter ginsenosidivorax]
MKNRIKTCLLLCFLLCTGSAFAQQGKVIEEQIVKSKILKRNVKYTIYLPADYETANRTYPVVYLLHGYSDDNTGWLQFGEINRFADQAILDGTIPPMIIVMPDGGTSWYINSYDGKEKYEDFFIKEFIPHIEQAYRIKTERQYRGVAGLSMGGYGTMIYAIKYPQLFSAAAALSAAVFPDDQMVNQPDDNYEHVFGQLFGRGLKGKDRLTKDWQANSVLNLVQNKTTDELSKVRYWIDCGDDDFLTIGNSMLHIALTEKKVPHEFRMRDGAHNWTYWRTGITNALSFIGDGFRQK